MNSLIKTVQVRGHSVLTPYLNSLMETVQIRGHMFLCRINKKYINLLVTLPLILRCVVKFHLHQKPCVMFVLQFVLELFHHVKSFNLNLFYLSI